MFTKDIESKTFNFILESEALDSWEDEVASTPEDEVNNLILN